MHLERIVVSRKTPHDGKLEISPSSASRLSALGDDFEIESDGLYGTARVSSVECTCEKAAGGRHVHYFLEAPLLRDLAAGTTLDVELDEEAAWVRLVPA